MRETYLYMIETIECFKAVKIGISYKPIERLRTLQACCPIRLRLAGKYACNLRRADFLEGWFHGVLSPHYLHGEWFALNAIEALRIFNASTAYENFFWNKVTERTKQMRLDAQKLSF